MLLFSFGAPEILLTVLIVLLLFGGKKIPELMRGLGKGVNEFKKGMKDVSDDITREDISQDDKSTSSNK